MLSFILAATAMSNDPVNKLRVNTRNMMFMHDKKNNFPVAAEMHRAMACYYKTEAPLPSCADAEMLSKVDDNEIKLSPNLKKYLEDMESKF
ncbi:hypothetical protein EXVG_00392 [Emiliania huxleyi virus 202]|nr:hypothetical protein EXVG_00392 [Emiliania huxleyi virus 202]AHA54351.1 hypothetical protein EhV18_00305 [Emiliania huxleyi virus 18]AHA55389.1 hypothetical protein EhV156_00294 [Emiliania huxleyi virus 156]